MLGISHIFQIRWVGTAENTVTLPSFLVWKFCGKAQFSHIFGRFTQNHTATLSSHKISTPGNCLKLRLFSQWDPSTLNCTSLYCDLFYPIKNPFAPSFFLNEKLIAEMKVKRNYFIIFFLLIFVPWFLIPVIYRKT